MFIRDQNLLKEEGRKQDWVEEKAECDSGPTEPREPSSECWSRNCSSESHYGAPNAPMRYFLREALKITTEMYSFSGLEARSPTPRCQQGCAPSGGSREGSFLASSSCGWLQVFPDLRLQHSTLRLCLYTASSVCLSSKSPSVFFLQGHLSLDLGVCLNPR